jgi:predicted small lipoprotein YifL
MSLGLPLARTILIAGLAGLSVVACGRRGALEPPPGSTPNAVAETATSEETDALLPSPVGTNSRRRAREPITVPKQPFILDPLL